MRIEDLVVNLSSDPFNPELNFACAKEYDSRGQTASAVSFYLRTAEFGYETHPDLAYQSLLRMSICFETQNDRRHTVSNCILQAVALQPQREEGYFLMSRFHERNSEWRECFTWAELGLYHSLDKANEFLDYPGKLGLLFEKAVSAWWIGRADDSISTFMLLKDMENLPLEYKVSVENNLTKVGKLTS